MIEIQNYPHVPGKPHRDDEEQKKKSFQIEVWIGKDGNVATVNESGNLGTKELIQSVTDPKVYECIGANDRKDSKIPVSFTLETLGTIGTTPKVGEGVHSTVKDVKFDALKWLDEPEKVAALSEEEKTRLKNIGVKELNDIVLAGLAASPRVWTPFIDAAQAIMQHANGTQKDFPQPLTMVEPDMNNTADHADGAVATLRVGDHAFTVGGDYFMFVGYEICKGKPRYAFTWMEIPAKFLDEPK